MNEFENELNRALKHIEPPAGFTERLLERLSREASTAAPQRWYTQNRQWQTVAAALLLLAGSGVLYQHHEQQMKGEAAKAKLLVALRIAGSKLQQAQEQVQRVESPEMN